jgi:tRNA modification GTPase
MPVAQVRLQTPPGRGGIAVLCVAGPGAEEVLQSVFEPLSGSWDFPPDRLHLGRLVGPDGPIDQALLCRQGNLWELNLHGGPGVTTAAMEQLARAGAGPQGVEEADEALLSIAGSSLYAQELLGALSTCRSETALTTLAHQLEGGLAALVASALSARTLKEEIRDRMRQASERLSLCRKLLNGWEIVLLGPPNAGKSALANTLVGRPVSLVHNQPGTTRDWVREEALVCDWPVWITDTAGLWPQAQGIDAQGVQRARDRAASADLICLVSPGASAQVPHWLKSPSPLLKVAGKCDICPPGSAAVASVSSKTGQGVDRLRRAIAEKLGILGWNPAEPTAFTSRQARLLVRAAEMEDPRAALRELLGQDA